MSPENMDLLGHSAVLVLLGYFIISVVFLGIFWRIAIALDRIAHQLLEIAKDLRKMTFAVN